MLLRSRRHCLAVGGVLALILLSTRQHFDTESFPPCDPFLGNANTTAMQMASRYDLTGRCLVITGGDSGLGFAVAMALLAAKADIVLCSHNAAKGWQQAERLRRRVNRSVLGVVGMDLYSLANVRAAAPAILRLCNGRIDALLANAGIAMTQDNHPVTADGFDDVFQVDALSHTLLVELLLPALREAKGRVIYTSSLFALSACLPDYSVPRFANGSFDLVHTRNRIWSSHGNVQPFEPACITLKSYVKAALAQAPLSFVRSGPELFLNGHPSGERLLDDGKRLGILRYSLAKLTFNLQAAELAKREEGYGVTAYSVDPGIVATAMWSCKEDEPGHAAGWPLNAKCGNAYTLGISEEEYAKRVAENAKSLNAPTAELSGGAATLAWLAAAPRVGALSRGNGLLFQNCQPKTNGSVRAAFVADFGAAATSDFQARMYEIVRAWALNGRDAVVVVSSVQT